MNMIYVHSSDRLSLLNLYDCYELDKIGHGFVFIVFYFVFINKWFKN